MDTNIVDRNSAGVSNVTLSIVIPMYNCEAVITRCLDSLDYPDSEIIVVDDGSTDRSAKTVSQYITTHPKVRLLQKANGGVSSARNVGIEESSGKYLMFVDADDYLAPDGISRIVEIAEKYTADSVVYGNITKHEKSPIDKESIKDFYINISVVEGRAAALKTYKVPDYLVWNSLFRRSVIVDNNIRFDEDLHLREDDAFMGKFYCFTSKVVVTNLPLYRYIGSSPFSSTHNQSKERNRLLIKSGLLAIKHRSQFIKENLPCENFPYERLKYMRWVCSPRQAVAAGYSYGEYRNILKDFRKEGVWPVSYKWIKVAGWDYNLKVYTKKIITTWLLNHPLISYPIAKIRHR